VFPLVTVAHSDKYLMSRNRNNQILYSKQLLNAHFLLLSYASKDYPRSPHVVQRVLVDWGLGQITSCSKQLIICGLIQQSLHMPFQI